MLNIEFMEEKIEDSIDKVQEAIKYPKKPFKYGLKKFHKNPKFYIASLIWSVVSTAVGLFFYFQLQHQLNLEKDKTQTLMREKASIEKQLEELKNLLEKSDSSASAEINKL